MLTNEQMFNQLIGAYGSMEKHTAPASLAKLKSIGFDGLSYSDIQTQAEWAALTLQFTLINLQVGRVQDVFARHSFGEGFGLDFGGIAQKILIDPISTMDPGWVGLKDGDSPDQFAFLDSAQAERFWRQNFNYAAGVSIRDDFFQKTVFSSEYGMSLFTQGKMTALENAFTEQGYDNKVARLNEILNSTKHPLKDTQKYQTTIPASGTISNDQIVEFAKGLRKVIRAMCDLSPATDSFNSLGFRTTQDKASLHLIARAGYLTDLEFSLPQINHYPTDPLGDLDIIEVPDFGGLQYYSDEAHTNRIYPAKDKEGRQVKDAWSTTEDGTTSTTPENVYTVDPNANVCAMLLDTGIIFDCQQNPYTVEPARNRRGKFTTFWAARPNELLGIDYAHNGVAFYLADGQA